MPFTKLKLTTFGTTLETKWKQGKGVHFTRIAMGDGLIGSGSMINRTALVHERHSLRIDGVVATDDAAQAAVIATLDNKDLTEGFLYRELALMAQDPDTGQEGAYLYDNAGQECEYLDTQANGVLIYERLKMLIRVEQEETISFEASGNPLNITWADIEPLLGQKADLGEDGKVPAAQLPAMDFDPAGSAAAVQTALSGHTGDNVRHLTAAERETLTQGFALLSDKVDTHIARTDNPHGVTAAQVGAVPTTRKVNGKALSADVTLAAADVGAAAASHSHGAGDIASGTLDAARIPDLVASKITSGTLPVARGGTGAASLTSGAALIGAGTGAVTTRAIKDNTSASAALTASSALVTMNTLRYALNRTTGPGAADTNYTTAMMRAIQASTTDLTAGSSSLTSGVIYLVYE